MAENPHNPVSDHDGVARITHGAVNARTAANAVDLVGGFIPGVGGVVAQATGVALNTEADSGETKTGIDFLAARMGISTEQLRAESKFLNDDDMQYQDGSALGKGATKAGVQVTGALIGGAVGGAVLPGFGIGAGTILGGIAGNMAGGAANGWIFKDKGATDTQYMCEMCAKQDDGSLTAEDIVRLVGRKTNSQSQRDNIERQMTAGNSTGFGLTSIAQQYLGPMLINENNPLDSHDPGRETEFEYVARMCREGKLDVAQLSRDTERMEFTPPRSNVQQAPAGDTQLAMDYADVDEALPPSSSLPRDRKDRGRRDRDPVLT
jgi:hypothetical protein